MSPSSSLWVPPMTSTGSFSTTITKPAPSTVTCTTFHLFQTNTEFSSWRRGTFTRLPAKTNNFTRQHDHLHVCQFLQKNNPPVTKIPNKRSEPKGSPSRVLLPSTLPLSDPSQESSTPPCPSLFVFYLLTGSQKILHLKSRDFAHIRVRWVPPTSGNDPPFPVLWLVLYDGCSGVPFIETEFGSPCFIG